MLGALIILLAGSTLYLLIKPLSAPDYVQHTSMKRSVDHQKLLMENPSFSLFSESNLAVVKISSEQLDGRAISND